MRRLLRHIMRWIRQLLAQLRGTKLQKKPTPQQQYPTVPQRPNALLPKVPPPEQQRPRQGNPPAIDTAPGGTAPSTTPQKQLNPASPRATSHSNFEVLLSDYQRPPSSAVQDLNRQLLDDDESSPAADGTPVTSIPPQDSLPGTAAAEMNQLRQQNTRPYQQSVILPQETVGPPTADDNLSDSLQSIPDQSIQEPTEYPKAGIITKRGVVKLLFKIKKNNYHGYITPHDGSKDIIFHQKYINEDVFCQLERGMEVEVTAHITEGKAYADHVRIIRNPTSPN